MKKEVVRLEIDNQELRRLLKKTEGENSKNKELLKQYQNYSKRHGMRCRDDLPEKSAQIR